MENKQKNIGNDNMWHDGNRKKIGRLAEGKHKATQVRRFLDPVTSDSSSALLFPPGKGEGLLERGPDRVRGGLTSGTARAVVGGRC